MILNFHGFVLFLKFNFRDIKCENVLLDENHDLKLTGKRKYMYLYLTIWITFYVCIVHTTYTASFSFRFRLFLPM